MTVLSFIDTETISLHPHRRAWDIAVIRCAPGKEPQQFQWFVTARDLHMQHADQQSLQIGRFYERHPEFAESRWRAEPESTVLREVEQVTRGTFLVGCNTPFDAETLAPRMRMLNIAPSWHYRTQCVQAYLRGYLAAKGQAPPLDIRSDDLFEMIGVDVAEFERHTAMGDVQLAMAVWNAVYFDTGLTLT